MIEDSLTKMTSGLPVPGWFIVLISIAYAPIRFAIYIIERPSVVYLRYKDRQDKKPVRPLPRDRKRALTLPFQARLPEPSLPWYRKDSTVHEKTFDQSQSPFFPLPLELRELIYRQVIVPSDGADLHVARLGDRLCCVPCNESDSSLWGWKHHCLRPYDHRGRSVYRYPPLSRSRGFFGLLQSCRKMYSESIDLLYTGATLNISTTEMITAMERVIIPHRLNSISSLHLDTQAVYPALNTKRFSSIWPIVVLGHWKGACDTLSRMQGLQNLKISLTRQQFWRAYHPDMDGLVWLLQPLMAVRQVSTFNVVIYWPKSIDMEELQRELGEKPPFHLDVVVTHSDNCYL